MIFGNAPLEPWRRAPNLFLRVTTANDEASPNRRGSHPLPRCLSLGELRRTVVGWSEALQPATRRPLHRVGPGAEAPIGTARRTLSAARFRGASSCGPCSGRVGAILTAARPLPDPAPVPVICSRGTPSGSHLNRDPATRARSC